jgi:hypothetical protein
MRYHEAKAARPSVRPAFLARLRQDAATLGLKSGFITPARRAATPNVIDCLGLTREDLGDERFEHEFHHRRVWCKYQCPNDHEIEPIRESMVLVGYKFRFARDSDAALFKMFFG